MKAIALGGLLWKKLAKNKEAKRERGRTTAEWWDCSVIDARGLAPRTTTGNATEYGQSSTPMGTKLPKKLP